MNITKEQYARIEKYFPVQRGNVKIDNYTFINAILYIAENGCKWRALPEKYGKWNSIYQRFKRWCENGVIQRQFDGLFFVGATIGRPPEISVNLTGDRWSPLQNIRKTPYFES